MKKETEIQYEILTFLQENGIFCWRNNSMGVYSKEKGVYLMPRGKGVIKGVSDILGVLPDGKMLAIEVKSASGKLTPEQKTFLLNAGNRGAIAMWARSLDEVIDKMAAEGYVI